MTDERKKYKILKIDKYKQQISEGQKGQVGRAFLLGLYIIGTINIYAKADSFEDITTALIATACCGYAAKDMYNSNVKKTELEEEIEELQKELEESKGMKK